LYASIQNVNLFIFFALLESKKKMKFTIFVGNAIVHNTTNTHINIYKYNNVNFVSIIRDGNRKLYFQNTRRWYSGRCLWVEKKKTRRIVFFFDFSLHCHYHVYGYTHCIISQFKFQAKLNYIWTIYRKKIKRLNL
jgi:hypothetical protein